MDGETVETVTAERPLQFVYGAGFMLPAFEAQLEGKQAGDEFAFRLEAQEAYGEMTPDAVVELPKEVFMIDGKIQDGNRLVGVVKEVKDASVTMDFNHPMAGKALDFTGKIVEVREATPADMMMGHHAGGCGCDCGCGEGGDCGGGCDDHGHGGCGCGC